MAGSFAANGKGQFTDLGGNVVGSLDINTGSPQSIALIGSNAGAGFYTVGTDPAGVGDIGCLLLYGSDGSSRIFRFSLGQVNGGVATAGRITEYDDQGGNGVPSEVSGLLLRQDPTAFASGDTSHLQTNYAFGLTGVTGAQASAAGALVLNPVSGAITNSDFDAVSGGGTPLVERVRQPNTSRNVYRQCPRVLPRISRPDRWLDFSGACVGLLRPGGCGRIGIQSQFTFRQQHFSRNGIYKGQRSIQPAGEFGIAAFQWRKPDGGNFRV
jgi:hypothetical protein